MSRSTMRAPGLVAVAVFAATALAGCSTSHAETNQNVPSTEPTIASCEAKPQDLTIATGNATGVYYLLGGAIAEVLSDETPLRATAVETGASVENIEQVVAGTYQLGFSLADTASDAVAGTGAFTEPQPIQAIGQTHTNYTHVIVRKDRDITQLWDLKGKTVSTGSPKSGTEVIALRLLEAAGLTRGIDLTTQSLDLAASVAGLRDGSLDALIWSGGLPTPNIAELFTADAGSFDFLDVTPALAQLQKLNPVYARGAIPADVYATPAAVPTIVVPNLLIVRDTMDDGTTCAITTAIWSNAARIAEAHPAGRSLTVKDGFRTHPVPLAPGSEFAFKEKLED